MREANWDRSDLWRTWDESSDLNLGSTDLAVDDGSTGVTTNPSLPEMESVSDQDGKDRIDKLVDIEMLCGTQTESVPIDGSSCVKSQQVCCLNCLFETH